MTLNRRYRSQKVYVNFYLTVSVINIKLPPILFVFLISLLQHHPCSCSPSLCSNPGLHIRDRQTDRQSAIGDSASCGGGREGLHNKLERVARNILPVGHAVYVTSQLVAGDCRLIGSAFNWNTTLSTGRKHDRRGATTRHRTTLDHDTTINCRTDSYIKSGRTSLVKIHRRCRSSPKFNVL